ncbi:YopX family protein [Lactiplantibacillus plantarum]|uniref:YopX family protein n=1 Tax=Lactiplantibacillus plantarum TaxID=1590 RepID=UPI001CFD72DD|nr:YopX family protein [Lactiplantibacillus plantarum]GJI52590.1 YopX family protein [Lactiplantibacillus plantarum]
MIKFRAWDKVQKVMLTPRDIETDSDGNVFYVEATGSNGEYDEGDLDVFKLEQFTGLKDVSGKDIYEGDILENRKYRSIVKFASGKFLADLIETIQTFDLIGETHGSKVIGNVHENPELLEVGK